MTRCLRAPLAGAALAAHLAARDEARRAAAEAADRRAKADEMARKVLLIDEAYILDPRRKNNQYGGNVLDTLVEKLDGEAGADIAVILAGYKQEMFDMLDNNPGLRRRFNIDDFGMHFQDMSDEELKQVLVAMASNCGLVFENVDLVDVKAKPSSSPIALSFCAMLERR